MNQIYRSPSQPYAATSKLNFPLDFLPRTGPRGGRNVIEKIHIQTALAITTQAANTIVGADMANFNQLIRITDSVGPRFYMTGAEARITEHLELFGAVPDDPATHAASTTQTDTFDQFIHFSQQESARRRWDFAMPVDDIKGGQVEITCPTAAQVFQTGSGATINGGTYTLFVHCREEWDVEMHSRDVREFVPQQINNAMSVNFGGSLLRQMIIFKDAQGGGTDLSSLITDITIEPLQLIQIPRAVLRQLALNRVPVKTAQDPVFSSKCLPIVVPRTDAKQSDFVAIPAGLLIRATSTLTLPFDIIVHRIAPKDLRVMTDAAVENRVDPREQPRVKTAGKSQTNPNSWGKASSFLPLKYSRPR